MNSLVTKSVIRAVLLILLQGLVFRRIAFQMGDFAFIHLFIYPIIILLLPIRTPKILQITIAFLVGLSIDAFYSSYGIHASAMVFTAYIRNFIIKLLEPHSGYNVDESPTLNRLGFSWFLSFASILFFVHLFFYFSVEAFSFVFFFEILMNTIFSFIASILMVVLYQLIFRSNY